MTDAGHGLLGRDRVLDELSLAFADDRPVAVIGEAGIGKTSVVRAAVLASERRLVEGGCFSTLRSMPYLPLQRAVRTALSGDPPRVAEIVERDIGPDIMFIDDLQWADPGSQAVIALLAERIQLVVAIRSGDDGTATATATAAGSAMLVVELGGLEPAAARTLVERARPDLRPAEVLAIVARGSGNPLFLEELARDGLTPVASRALAARLVRLSGGARRTIGLLAVADRAISRDRLGPAVEEICRSGLADERDGLVLIHHALLAEAVVDQLTEDERRAAHIELARLMVDPVDVARHLAAGGRPREAATVALGALDVIADPADRATLLTLAAGDGPPTLRFERRLEAARLLDQLSDWDRVVDILGPTGEDGSTDQLVERDMLLVHAGFALGDVAAARERLAAASDRQPDLTGPAAALRALESAEFLVNVDGAVAKAIGLLDAQIAIQPAEGEAQDDLRSLRDSILMLATGSVDIPSLRASADAAYAEGRFRTAADRARVAQYALLMSVGADAAVDYSKEQSARFAASGASGVAMGFRAEAVAAAILAGRIVDAIAMADELLEGPTPLRVLQPATISRARALALLGRFDDAFRTMDELARVASVDYFGSGEWLVAQAEIAFWSGRPDRAVELAERGLAIPSPVVSATILPTLTLGWARYENGEAVDLAILPVATLSLAGAADESAGLGYLARRETAAAASAFGTAATAWARFNAPRSAFCRWAEGEAMRLEGATESAVDRLGRTLADAEAMSFAPLSARTRRSLRLAGVRLASERGPRDPSGLRLTPREREIAGLVERGLTNVEIARRLGLGRPTVARILGSAMQKLGVDRRTQLAGLTVNDPASTSRDRDDRG